MLTRRVGGRCATLLLAFDLILCTSEPLITNSGSNEELYASLLSAISSTIKDEGFHGSLVDAAEPPERQEASISATGEIGEQIRLRGGAGGSRDTPWRAPVPVSDTPRIYVVDGFATAQECHEMFAAFEPGLEQSQTMNADGSKRDDSKGRKSRQHTMGPSRWTALMRSVVERMDSASMQPGENGQQLTVTDYELEDEYQLHVDSAFSIGRVATAILFVRAPEEGGELIFPWARLRTRIGYERPEGVHGAGRPVEELFARSSVPRFDELGPLPAGLCNRSSDSLLIEPRVGRLVVFFNHDPMGRTLRPRSLHGSCPVRRGHKSIAQRFYQWHELQTPNHLGTLLEQVERAKGKTWFVDWRVDGIPEEEAYKG